MPIEYIKFVHQRFSESGKTIVFEVYNQDESHFLGLIKFKATWRRYCFYPEPNRLFDVSCMKAIIDFIELQMKLRVPHV